VGVATKRASNIECVFVLQVFKSSFVSKIWLQVTSNGHDS
jgi:hypothetical protein